MDKVYLTKTKHLLGQEVRAIVNNKEMWVVVEDMFTALGKIESNIDIKMINDFLGSIECGDKIGEFMLGESKVSQEYISSEVKLCVASNVVPLLMTQFIPPKNEEEVYQQWVEFMKLMLEVTSEMCD